MAWARFPRGLLQLPIAVRDHCAQAWGAACRWVSLLGAAMSAMYSTIAFAASVAAGSHGASYELRRESRALQVFGAFNALGTVMFAFGGHAILLEVQVNSRL